MHFITKTICDSCAFHATTAFSSSIQPACSLQSQLFWAHIYLGQSSFGKPHCLYIHVYAADISIRRNQSHCFAAFHLDLALPLKANIWASPPFAFLCIFLPVSFRTKISSYFGITSHKWCYFGFLIIFFVKMFSRAKESFASRQTIYLAALNFRNCFTLYTRETCSKPPLA